MMGSVNGISGSDPLPVDINEFLREISESDFDCLFPSLDDEEMGDNFSLFDNKPFMADSEINLCHDLQLVNLNVPSNEWMCDNLINGDIQNNFNPFPLDDVALETPNLQPSLLLDGYLVAKNTSIGSTAEDLEKSCVLKLDGSDAGKTESELRKKGINLLCEAATVKQNKKLDARNVGEEEALDIDNVLNKLKRKACITEFEPRKKSCYNHKGISLRLTRLRTGN